LNIIFNKRESFAQQNQKHKTMKTDFKTVDEYISAFPKDIQLLLENVRASIIKKAPEAIESISYGMPAYKTNGKPLVYFAGYKKHIGFYATPTGHTEFANELSNYKQGKGSVQFPIDHPIPYWLIEQIVVFRVKEVAKSLSS
jgi:uncharacterized protein YdhG (YjbR/CyaY superfamily)